MELPVVREQRRARMLVIAGWTGALVVHRVAVILLGFDGAFFWEEAYRVFVAQALVQGWAIPLVDLQADPYQGGSLVVSVLYVPLLWTFGPSIIGLKLVVIAWTAAGLAIWLYAVEKVFGRATAHAFGLLFVLAPPVFAVFNVIAMGSHQETVTLSGLQFLLLYRFVRGERRVRDLAAWAIVGGLSIWFSYVSAVTLVLCIAFAFAAGALPVRRWLPAAGFVLVGLLPAFVYNLAASGAGLQVVGRTFRPIVNAGAGWLHWYLAAGSDLLKYGIPRALMFNDLHVSAPMPEVVMSGKILAYAIWLLFLVCWGTASLRCAVGITREWMAAGRGKFPAVVARFPELPLLLFFPMFVSILATSEHDFSAYPIVPFLPSRVLIPFFPVMFFTIALAITRATRSWQRWGVVTLCIYAICGLLGTRQLLAAGSATLAATQTDILQTGAEAFGHLLVYKRANDVERIAERIAIIEEKLRPAAYRGVGFSLAYLYFFQSDRPAAQLSEDVNRIGAEYRKDARSGLETAFRVGLAQVAALPRNERRAELARSIGLIGAGSEPLPR